MSEWVNKNIEIVIKTKTGEHKKAINALVCGPIAVHDTEDGVAITQVYTGLRICKRANSSEAISILRKLLLMGVNWGEALSENDKLIIKLFLEKQIGNV